MNKAPWTEQYNQAVGRPPVCQRKPLIGITGNYGEKGCELGEGYYRSVVEAGGIPVVVPPFSDEHAMTNLLDRLDGILLSGGGDLNPLLLGEQPVPGLGGVCPERDMPELLLTRMAYDRQVPILGICRGIQVLACALGGTVWQDLGSQYDGPSLIKHSQQMPRHVASHHVQITEGSLLQHIMEGQERIAVNSFHHQAVRTFGPLLRPCATADDGVTEAVESTCYKSVLGVQWHPECFILQGDTSMMSLFRWLVDEARSFAQARQVHEHILTLDSHCDTPMCLDKAQQEGLSPARLISSRTDIALVDAHKMDEGRLDATVMVAYLPQGERNAKAYEQVRLHTDYILDQIDSMVEACPTLEPAATPAMAMANKRLGLHSIFKGIENGYAIGNDLGLISHFRQRDVVYMTLCHNGDNDICDSARGKSEHGGVSAFGQQVIERMNQLGMMVDMSHAAEDSFYDALHISRVPIVCSHSSSRCLCNHPRNLTDDQLRALAQKDGVAQVTFYNGFLRTSGEATIRDVVAHINHFVKVMGIEHVGIGTDFDGDGGVRGVASASELINVTRRLLAERYGEDDLRLLWGGNFLRVMDAVQHGSTQSPYSV